MNLFEFDCLRSINQFPRRKTGHAIKWNRFNIHIAIQIKPSQLDFRASQLLFVIDLVSACLDHVVNSEPRSIHQLIKLKGKPKENFFLMNRSWNKFIPCSNAAIEVFVATANSPMLRSTRFTRTNVVGENRICGGSEHEVPRIGIVIVECTVNGKHLHSIEFKSHDFFFNWFLLRYSAS